MQSLLKVSDNSGAKTVKCIKVLGGSNHMSAKIGQLIVVAIQKIIPSASLRVKKGQVCKAVIVRSKYGFQRNDGTKLVFGDNAVVLLDQQLNLIGTRVFGPVTRELKAGFNKIYSLADRVL